MIDRASFAAAWRELGARGDSAELHRRLVACWSQKHRHYHTLQHLRECFEHVAATQSQMKRPAEVAMALWFHDAFYDPAREDNEKRSADWARDAAIEAGVPHACAQRVYDMVMATVSHTGQSDGDAQLLVDIDLSIFGAEDMRFDESNEQIRREFAHVPEPEWRVARKRMLGGFLDRPRLYSTDHFHAMLEDRAKRNIARALERLEG
ncbi:MAG TPA: N-methyl-D-aspartate receptor NMDAR2C subunit [Ramlibacter sp.]|nr:N-methyl-D-aspartate receptor NMDAR2C subunit [Ramlibacter sp.]